MLTQYQRNQIRAIIIQHECGHFPGMSVEDIEFVTELEDKGAITAPEKRRLDEIRRKFT